MYLTCSIWSSLNIDAIPKCITLAHFVLLIENFFTIAESGNIVLKSLFVSRHDLYEKWLSTTFKTHLISATLAIPLGSFTDDALKLVWGELSLTGSLTAFWSSCLLIVPAVFCKNNAWRIQRYLFFLMFFIFRLMWHQCWYTHISVIYDSFLLIFWVFLPPVLNQLSCNQKSQKLVYLFFGNLIVYSDCKLQESLLKEKQLAWENLQCFEDFCWSIHKGKSTL